MEIIYQDKDVIAINKPAGMSMHPDRFHAGDTLADFLVENYPEVKHVGDISALPDQGYRAGIVHRLDKDTSGIMIVARTQEAFDFFKKQFQERLVKKEYSALVVGRVKNKTGVISLSIGRSKNDPTKRIAKGSMRGKIREAVTEYKVQEYFFSDGKEYTLLVVFPKTGRTHQVRTHFKAIEYPVVCDKLYAGKRFICPFGLSRQFLHANAIELTLPSGSRIRLEAELAEDLNIVLKGLRKQQNSDKL